ncbi:MAG: Do family serine endopeptidase [Pseudomonadota bacterium]
MRNVKACALLLSLFACLALSPASYAQSAANEPSVIDRLFGRDTGPADAAESETGQVMVPAQRVVPENPTQVQLSFAPIVRLAAPAVVNVYATRMQSTRDPFASMDPFFRRFFGDQMPRRPRQRMASSLGSGVIVDPSGIIVTNNHVIEGAEEVQVSLSDRREFPADILIRDERTDLAILQVRNVGAELPFMDVGVSDALEVGDIVLAIGNPFGVGQTVTQGIVSALARSDVGITDFQSFIQTDAAINPGNSGGALIDMRGRLVGINTAIFSRSGGSNGIGFAIPTEMVGVVVNQASSGAGFVARPYLGADLQDVTPAIAESMELARPTGALIADIDSGGAADRAGLRPGDVVVAVDGVPVNSASAFTYRFALLDIGAEAEIELMRRGRRLQAEIELEAPPETIPRDIRTIGGRSPFSGVEVINLSPAVAQEFGFDDNDGVMIVDISPRSAASRVGFRSRDQILEVNGVEIDQTQTLEMVAQAQQRRWDIVFERDGRVRSVVLGF